MITTLTSYLVAISIGLIQVWNRDSLVDHYERHGSNRITTSVKVQDQECLA